MTGPVAFSCSRCSHLDSGHYFFELVYLACACRSFGVNLRLLLEEFQFSFGDFERSHLEIWTLGYSFCAILGSTVDTSSSIAVGRFWTSFQYCLSEGELGSCGRFTSCSSGSCSLEKCAQSVLLLRGLPELMAPGIWTLFSRAPSS